MQFFMTKIVWSASCLSRLLLALNTTESLITPTSIKDPVITTLQIETSLTTPILGLNFTSLTTPVVENTTSAQMNSTPVELANTTAGIKPELEIFTETLKTGI